MSNKVLTQGPCPDCTSSDAYTVYSDGGTYCYSCGTYHPPNSSRDYIKEEIHLQTIPFRGLNIDTCRKFSITAKCVGDEQQPIEVSFPFSDEDSTVRLLYPSSHKYRGVNHPTEGKLFGQHLFDAGSAKAVTIYEGALDTASGYQMLGDYPAVGVVSSTSALKMCRNNREYLDAFDKIVLCFDNDKAGIEATKEVATLFDFNKVYVVRLDRHNDVNEYLNHDPDVFKKLWWAARKLVPEGIVSSYSDLAELLANEEDKPSVSYPFKSLQEKTFGIRTGETVLLTALEGVGKTEILRAIEYHVCQEEPEDVKLGIIHLEEPIVHSIRRFAGLEIGRPVHLPTSDATDQEVMACYRKATRSDDRIHYYSLYGSPSPATILNAIRFLVSACQCKYIFFDHLTKVVTGMDVASDERKTLDYLMTNLDMMTKELDFALLLVSHVNDEGRTRGSRNISKEALVHIALERDLEHPNPKIRNTTKLIVKKNRFGANTGPAGNLLWDNNSWLLTEDEELEETLEDELTPKLEDYLDD